FVQSLMKDNDEKLIRIFCSKLDPLLASVDEKSLRDGCLSNLMAVVSREPTWETTHYAAACGFLGFLKTALEKDSHLVLGFATREGEFPVHIAAKSNQLEVVRLLLEHGADLCQKDAMGRTVIHWAAANSPSTLKELSSEVSFTKATEIRDEYGMIPLAVAIHEANFESTKILMACPGSISSLPKEAPPLLSVLCGMKHSEGLAKYVLMEVLKHSFENININKKDGNGQTPLHLATNRGDIGGVVALLCYGADANARDHEHCSPLMRAVQVGNLELIKLLLLFDADLSAVDGQGQSVHDIVKTSKRSVLYFMADVDALLAVMNPPQPSPHAAKMGNHKNTSNRKILAPWEHQQEVSIKFQRDNKNASGELVNVLSLDGGGIRGLILIQVLSELEKKLGVSILSRFHWLGGTSTGAILALALSQGKSIAHCRSIYFRLKDDVFCGPRPYSDVVLESFLKSEFGEHTTLADIKTKKVMVTTCLANVCPSKLKLFRNYQLHLPSDENDHMGFCSPKNVLVYVAARCSRFSYFSAAPTYFPPFEGKYMDGGLIANNPCSQLISDIQLMNTSFQMAGKAEHCYRIGCIVSIGTGQTPEAFVESLNLSLPKNIAEVVGLTKNLAVISHMKNLFIDQLANADGSVVDYARSWSHSISVPFFRFSPSLNPAVELDETDDVKLINMMWNTKVYMNEESYSVNHLMELLELFKK
ncbi:hypothetical protein Angca_003644, partial [Angiostrongylus cantonensis]